MQQGREWKVTVRGRELEAGQQRWTMDNPSDLRFALEECFDSGGQCCSRYATYKCSKIAGMSVMNQHVLTRCRQVSRPARRDHQQFGKVNRALVKKQLRLIRGNGLGGDWRRGECRVVE